MKTELGIVNSLSSLPDGLRHFIGLASGASAPACGPCSEHSRRDKLEGSPRGGGAAVVKTVTAPRPNQDLIQGGTYVNLRHHRFGAAAAATGGGTVEKPST